MLGQCVIHFIGNVKEALMEQDFNAGFAHAKLGCNPGSIRVKLAVNTD